MSKALNNFYCVILGVTKNLKNKNTFFTSFRMTMAVLSVVILMSSCRSKGPYNPYLKMKKDEKPSTINNKQIKELEDNSRKSGKKQMRKNRRKVYSN